MIDFENVKKAGRVLALKTEEEKNIARDKYNQIIQDIFDLIITSDNYEDVIEIVRKELTSLEPIPNLR